MMPEAEMETYLDAALWSRGVDPDALRPTLEGAAPESTDIPPELMSAIMQQMGVVDGR